MRALLAILALCFSLIGALAQDIGFSPPINVVNPAYIGPCDVLATAGTPCVAGHSMWRRMLGSYTGAIFQVELPATTTQDIGTLSTGYVDLPTLNSFCGVNNANSCTISKIYDQTANNNVLPQATLANQCVLAFSYFSPTLTAVPYANCASGHFYRNRAATSLIPTGSQSITEYMLVRTGGLAVVGTYGDVEATVVNTGNGHMFELSYATQTIGQAGTGAGPWAGVDWENGLYQYGTSPIGPYVVVLAKYRAPAVNTWQLKNAFPNNDSFTTQYDSILPNGYSAIKEGGISLGEGGDGTVSPVKFYEGAITATATLDATDNSLLSNIAGSYASPPLATKAACLSGNMVPAPLNFYNTSGGNGWSTFNVSTDIDPDPSGNAYAVKVTGTSTANNAQSASVTITVAGSTTYTITDEFLMTTGATTFPLLLASGLGTGALSYGMGVNTNTCANIRGTSWQTPTTATATVDGAFCKVKNIFTTAAGQTGFQIILEPPNLQASGALTVTPPIGRAATHYCPSLTLGAN